MGYVDLLCTGDHNRRANMTKITTKESLYRDYLIDWGGGGKRDDDYIHVDCGSVDGKMQYNFFFTFFIYILGVLRLRKIQP